METESAKMKTKRKRHVITVLMKLEALQRVDDGETPMSVCESLGVGRSTLHDWRKNESELREFYARSKGGDALFRRRTLKRSSNADVDDAVWSWYSAERAKGATVTGIMIKERAKALALEMNSKQHFIASDGWLSRWKMRHGIGVKVTKRSRRPENDPKSVYPAPGDGWPWCRRNAPPVVPKPEPRPIAPPSKEYKARVVKADHDDQSNLPPLTSMVKVEVDDEESAPETKEEIAPTELLRIKDAFEVALEYIQRQPDATVLDMMFAKKWRDHAVDRCSDTVRTKKPDLYQTDPS